ncbi:heterokaryon incompatibility protein-domain-containing protein [Fusarium solani]|uniref:Heterokaryon incompatibility protein-domain-containing protein n=1 Tax=Fusarium solani TaxID=169388 RepID=A0A9P9R849_FUSSL|nr:heterokaryon incompatibility protein-domain-containing protein [Fusarium solani]KAH7268630.1 heterokaryon incompatibility protein-domain-containing protein [Fusarium solani]
MEWLSGWLTDLRTALCPSCGRKLGPIDWKDDWNWVTTFQRIDEALALGCLRCIFTVDCLKACPTTASIDYSLIERAKAWKMHNFIFVRVKDEGSEVGLRDIDLELFSLQEGNTLDILQISTVRKPLIGDTSSKESFAMVSSWIDECLETHPGCAKTEQITREKRKFPARLLDLTNGKVVLREGIRPDRYVCLSHCWGKTAHTALTTKKTFKDHLVSINWECLTQTFQDAIKICRRLDIPFLWIDSLCIIQDCNEDWKREAALMGGIYESAFLTIAATKSSDSSGGCFSKADPAFLGSPVPGHLGWLVREQPTRFPATWFDLANESSKFPLLSRAWVYQEMRLSRRILHFCSDEIMWECRSARNSESGISNEYRDSEEQPFYLGITKIEAGKYAHLDCAGLWWQTVREFSRLNITYHTDKLPAMAALAERMAEMRFGDDKYLAGLWRSTLAQDLLWKLNSEPSCQPQPSGVPTWSWASTPCAVAWDTGYITMASFTIKNIHYEAAGPKYLGGCSTARIEIESPVVRIEQMNGASIALRHETGLASYQKNCTSEQDQQRTSGHFAMNQYKPDRAPDTVSSELYADTLFIPIACPESEWHLPIVGLHVGRRRGCCNYERLGWFGMEHAEYFKHFNRRLVTKYGWPYEHGGYKRPDQEPFTKRLLDVFLKMPREVITLV